jgi:hypothetical protein
MGNTWDVLEVDIKQEPRKDMSSISQHRAVIIGAGPRVQVVGRANYLYLYDSKCRCVYARWTAC